MSNHINYYDILEIPKTADENEIKTAYRKLAKKWHPDKNLNNTEEATAKFKEISIAYEVLSNPEKKKIYDEGGLDALQESENATGGVDPNEIFKEFLKKMGGMGGMMDDFFGRENDTGGIPDLELGLEISLSDAYNGSTIKTEIKRGSLCDKCDGTGAKDKKSDIKCKQCKGMGQILKQVRQGHVVQMIQMPCNMCRGSGIDKDVEKCKKCDGNSVIEETIEIEVKIPKGSHQNIQYGDRETRISMQGQGNEIPKEFIKDKGNKKKTRTDLIFVIQNVKEHDVFERNFLIRGKNKIDSSDLKITLKITLAESFAGIYKEIQHLDGHYVRIYLNHPIRHGDIFVIKGQGMPVYGKENKFGDLVVYFEVEHPKDILTDKLKTKILEDFGTKAVKLPKKTEPHEIINYDDYLTNIKIKADSEKMKQQFKHKNKTKSRHHHRNHNDTDDLDNSDNDSDDYSSDSFGGDNGGHQQCPVS